ncbi:DUF6053 domain-containing protein [Lysobacter enzymogenes]|uniref:DUF6053 domain-containing protein n=1 Tax=Lysobacter enzymogenes TaxID=69 RepID=UPI003D2F6BE3
MGGPSGPRLFGRIAAIGHKSVGPEGPPTEAALPQKRPSHKSLGLAWRSRPIVPKCDANRATGRRSRTIAAVHRRCRASIRPPPLECPSPAPIAGPVADCRKEPA